MKRTRYCPHGHDKQKPHGSYIVRCHGYLNYVCATCARERNRHNRKKK